jgi:hypothetical protein
MFRAKFRRKLSLLKYTRWAAALTEDQLAAVLWAVGEYGLRAQAILECIDRHQDEFSPGHGLPRARLALELLSRMVDFQRYSLDDVVEKVRAVVAEWRAQLGELQE